MMEKTESSGSVAPTSPSKAEYTTSKLRDMIIDGTIPAGSPLQERTLCTILNTSRTPVREAIHTLENEGLVVTYRGKGAFVTTITQNDLIRLYDVREYLEGLAANRAARFISESNLKKLKEICSMMKKAIEMDDLKKFYHHDIKFHTALVHSAGNELLTRIYDNEILPQTRRITNLSQREIVPVNHSYNAHLKTVEYIEQQDAENAELTLRKHIRESKQLHFKQFIDQVQ
ncbi:MAG: GntR family transcriptional regulator [Eubacteriales bacterium]|jgi:DNA-binding GntR family transcriptional regulator